MILSLTYNDDDIEAYWTCSNKKIMLIDATKSLTMLPILLYTIFQPGEKHLLDEHNEGKF